MRADRWGQCGRERRGGACLPARERGRSARVGLGRETAGPRGSSGPRAGGKSRPGRGALGLGLVPRKEVYCFLFNFLFPFYFLKLSFEEDF